MEAGPLEIRPAEFVALAHGRPLRLTARELQLLTALAEREGRIVSREELYEAVWGESFRQKDRSVDVYVGKVRHKLEDALPEQRFIHTHFGFGYRFAPEPNGHCGIALRASCPQGCRLPGGPAGCAGLSHVFHRGATPR
jgi:DNA-binding response OmpR family regulator